MEKALENLNQVLNLSKTDGDADALMSLRLPKRRNPTSLILIVDPAYLGFTLIQPTRSHDHLNFCQLASNFILGNNQVMASTITGTGTNSHVVAQRKWIMELGKVFVINIDVYDRNNHRLHSSKNIRLNIEFPATHFEVSF